MNEKIKNEFLSWIGVLASFVTISDLFDRIKNMELLKKVLLIISIIIAVTLPFYFVIQYKRKFANLYSQLRCMSVNNKLHPLRELILVVSDQIDKRDNRCVVNHAHYEFVITKNKRQNFDVRYHFSFRVKIPLWKRLRKKGMLFNFYVVAKKKRFSTFDMKISNDKHQKRVPVYYSVTNCGESGDCIKRFSAISRVEVIIPPLYLNRKEVEIEFSYDIKNNIRKKDLQYNFIVFPRNYGKRVKDMEVILISEEQFDNVKLDEYRFDGDYKTIGQFLYQDNTYVLCNDLIKPNMQSVYFLQFDWE